MHMKPFRHFFPLLGGQIDMGSVCSKLARGFAPDDPDLVSGPPLSGPPIISRELLAGPGRITGQGGICRD